MTFLFGQLLPLVYHAGKKLSLIREIRYPWLRSFSVPSALSCYRLPRSTFHVLRSALKGVAALSRQGNGRLPGAFRLSAFSVLKRHFSRTDNEWTEAQSRRPLE